MRGKLAALLFWLCLGTVFAGLRFDPSDRLYFTGDDHLVARLAEEIVLTGHWQPDWYRLREKIKLHEYYEQENAKLQLPHDHHYNFAAQILAGAGVLQLARFLGSDASTAALLHHLSFFWDGLSLLCIIGAAYQLGGPRLARTAAVLYTVFPLAVQGSHYARPDALLTATGSAMLWLALLYTRWPASRWIAANAACLAIGILAKASQLMLGIFPALVFLQALSTRAWRAVLPRILKEGLLLTGGILALLSLLFVASDMRWEDFILSTQAIMLYYRQPGPPDALEHYSYLAQMARILAYFHATLGSAWGVALLLGAIQLWRSQRVACVLLAAPLLLFTAYFAAVPAFFDRSFCPSAAAFVLLAAAGCVRLADTLTHAGLRAVAPVLLALSVSTPSILLVHDLYTDHLGPNRNEDRLAFQKSLKQDWPDFWLKLVDRPYAFGRTLPERPPKNPRIYIVEDFNDWNSRDYAALLREQGFVQIAEFTGDFAHVPTSSLLTVHEAARYRYFIRAEDLPPGRHPVTPAP